MEVLSDNNVKNGKTNAIISHFWLIGLVIAWVLNNNKKNTFTSFYIRQMIGFNILIILNKYIVYDMLGGFICWIVSVILFVLWFISIMGVIKEEEKLMPVFGEQFQQWFKNLG